MLKSGSNISFAIIPWLSGYRPVTIVYKFGMATVGKTFSTYFAFTPPPAMKSRFGVDAFDMKSQRKPSNAIKITVELLAAVLDTKQICQVRYTNSNLSASILQSQDGSQVCQNLTHAYNTYSLIHFAENSDAQQKKFAYFS